MQTFIAALFTRAKIWSPVSTTNVYIKNNMVPEYTMEFYSAIKKNKVLTFMGVNGSEDVK